VESLDFPWLQIPHDPNSLDSVGGDIVQVMIQVKLKKLAPERGRQNE
jgi:hypothetical protein